MVIIHTIKNAKGELVEVELSRKKAIRRFCVECMGFQKSEVPICSAPNCPLFPFRMGEGNKLDLTEEQRKVLSDRARKSFGHNQDHEETPQDSTI